MYFISPAVKEFWNKILLKRIIFLGKINILLWNKNENNKVSKAAYL